MKKYIKGFDQNLKCRGYQFEIGKEYKIENDGKNLELCSDTVFHFCESIQQVNNFYDVEGENRYCYIEVLGEMVSDDEKCGSNHIKILEEIKDEELDALLGKINGNTGLFNTGHRNTGHRNTGDCNTGLFNTGDCNTGHRNTGDRNTGHRNTGHYNTGHRNTGLFNSTNHSTGMFNSKEDTIKIFNKDTKMTYSQAKQTEWFNIIACSKFILTEWIEYTDEEKENSIIRQCIGGYLKEYTFFEACANWWNELNDEEKKIMQTIPNFDKEVFKEITGIIL